MDARSRCGAEVVLGALLALLGSAAIAQAVPAVTVTPLAVQAASAPLPDIVCTPRPGPPPPPPPPPTTEVPDLDEVRAALAELPAPALVPGATAPLPLPPAGQPLRIGVWGDSHMAAAVFTDELARGLGLREAAVRYVPAGVGHGGVRALLRKACVPAPWTRESAHAREAAAAAPGPGLVSLVVSEGEAAAKAVVALDLRDASGRPRHRVVQLLYGATGGTPARLALSVDGAPETEIELASPAGAAALELVADAPLSTLHLRVLQGPFRFQGLRLSPAEPPAAPVQLDVFGYPGATGGGWARADVPLLRAWFDERPYDLVVFAYGTNEANDRHFSAAAYTEQLSRSLAAWRQAFPEAACLVLGPGDRGVRVPARKRKGKAAKARRVQAAELLKYAKLHEQVAKIQAQAAQQVGCVALSLQALMGGRGSAYAWARTSPPRMAGDLLHFTPAGYRELAQRTAAALGWMPR